MGSGWENLKIQLALKGLIYRNWSIESSEGADHASNVSFMLIERIIMGAIV